MKVVFEKVMPPKSGLAVEVKKGQHLRVTDLEGKQVVDTAFFNLHNPREKLSTSYSRTRNMPEPGAKYHPRDHVEEGDYILSTLCQPMLTIVKESMEQKGVHDAHNRMCNRFLYEHYGQPQDGCHEIIAKAVEPYGLRMEDIPDTLDLFMNYPHNCEKGYWEIKEPITKPGDYIEFRAEMDVIAAMSNCPEDQFTDCNARHCTPVKVEVFSPE